MKTKLLLSVILITSLFISCGNIKTADTKSTAITDSVATIAIEEKFAPYKILRTEPYESSGKAQVKCYAYLATDRIIKDELTETLTKIYFGLRSYNNFKNFSAPTVIAIYLFTSEDKATNMTDSWIAMLSKSPSDNVPRISFDEMKMAAHEGSKGKEKSSDEKMLEELNVYFKKRNTDLCSIYKELYDLEGETIKQADNRYPNFGVEHSTYQSKLYKQEQKKLLKKYNINDTLTSYIFIFAMGYCK